MDIGRRGLGRLEHDALALRVVAVARDDPQHFVQRHDAGNRDRRGRLGELGIALRRRISRARRVAVARVTRPGRRQYTLAGAPLEALDDADDRPVPAVKKLSDCLHGRAGTIPLDDIGRVRRPFHLVDKTSLGGIAARRRMPAQRLAGSGLVALDRVGDDRAALKTQRFPNRLLRLAGLVATDYLRVAILDLAHYPRTPFRSSIIFQFERSPLSFRAKIRLIFRAVSAALRAAISSGVSSFRSPNSRNVRCVIGRAIGRRSAFVMLPLLHWVDLRSRICVRRSAGSRMDQNNVCV